MTDSPPILQARLNWVRTYQQTKNVGFICRVCSNSRSTLRKWLRRFEDPACELRESSEANGVG